jgi:hypothetical protein
MEKILAERPGTVVISASWLVNEKKRSIAESFDGKLQLLNTAIDRMSKAGIRVVVLGPAPVFPSPVPQIVASEAPGADGTAQASISRLFDRFFRDLEAKGRIAYLSAWELFCTRTIRCRYRDGKDWLFWDEGHLTSLGGKQVVKALVKKVGPL